MAQNITLLNSSYSAVPAVLLPKTGGGTAKFSDASITTAVESDVASGKKFLLADGSEGTGTASASAATRTIHIDNIGPQSSASTYVQLNGSGTKYWEDGTNIQFEDGDTLYIYANGSQGEGAIYVDGVLVAGLNYNAASYTYTLPAKDIHVSINRGGTSYVRIDNITADGSAGMPTAIKSTPYNHTVNVTPEVTNTAGFISSGTLTGSAVSVSASELVSGSETKTANGTYDVTNLALLIVAIPIVTYYTSSSAPTS